SSMMKLLTIFLVVFYFITTVFAQKGGFRAVNSNYVAKKPTASSNKAVPPKNIGAEADSSVRVSRGGGGYGGGGGCGICVCGGSYKGYSGSHGGGYGK
ncbi:hypothetical protein QYM36_006760, partial [Artemia franciscana]